MNRRIVGISAALAARNVIGIYNRRYMKARVYVSMKTTVLDPQGKTVCAALQSLGHHSLTSVRQGKYFEIAIAPGADRAKIAGEIDQIAREVLSNPVIEEYRVEILD